MRHQGLNLLKTHAFLDSPLHPDQPNPILVFQKFPNRTHPPIAQVIDVVHCPLGVLGLDEAFYSPENVILSKGAVTERQLLGSQLLIQLQPPHLGKVIVIRAKKEILEKLGCHLRGGGIAGP